MESRPAAVLSATPGGGQASQGRPHGLHAPTALDPQRHRAYSNPVARDADRRASHPLTDDTVAEAACVLVSSLTGPSREFTRDSSPDITHDSPEVKMVRAELAAVIPGRDRPDPRPARRRDSEPHRRFDRRRVGSVEHDLELAIHALGH